MGSGNSDYAHLLMTIVGLGETYQLFATRKRISRVASHGTKSSEGKS